MASDPPGGGTQSGRDHRSGRNQMLAFNAFGGKEIAVYVVVIVIVLILAGWYVMRGRSKA
jgi:hypothetical protein